VVVLSVAAEGAFQVPKPLSLEIDFASENPMGTRVRSLRWTLLSGLLGVASEEEEDLGEVGASGQPVGTRAKWDSMLTMI
jgi:hypothetical protein